MRIFAMLMLVLFLASCGQKHVPEDIRTATKKPYKIGDQWYYPLLRADGYDEKGIASWYGKKFHGNKTSNGEIYDMHAFSAAHPTLPMGTNVRVTNLENGRNMVLRINDRGPFVKSRLIDLSYAAAKQLDYSSKGTTRVRVQVVDGRSRAEVIHYSPTKSTRPSDVVRRRVTVTPVRALPEVQSEQLEVAVIRPRGDARPGWKKRKPEKIVSAKQSGVANAVNGVFVQIGAFASQENAERVRQKHLSNFKGLRLFATVDQSPVIYKVRQGPLANRMKAEELASRMEMAGVPSVSLVTDTARPAALDMKVPDPMVHVEKNKVEVAPASAMVQPASSTQQEVKGLLYVQLGAYSSLQRAEKVRDQYAAQYGNTLVHHPDVGKSSFYRVRIGPIRDVRKATSIIDSLEASGVEKPLMVVGK